MRKNVFTLNAKKKMNKFGLNEKMVLAVIKFGKKTRARDGAVICFIPKKKVRKSPYLKDLKNTFVVLKGTKIIEVFKNENFKIYA